MQGCKDWVLGAVESGTAGLKTAGDSELWNETGQEITASLWQVLALTYVSHKHFRESAWNRWNLMLCIYALTISGDV